MKKRIRDLLKDKLTREIVGFFYQNQASVDSARGVSAWVHKKREEVLPILESLLEAGVLEGVEGGRTKGYCYTHDKKTMDEVKKILKKD